MMDLARRIPMTTAASQLVMPPQDTPLQLEGGIPQTVYVRVVATEEHRKVYFSLPGGQEHHGIEWKCGGYALLITFVFEKTSDDIEITELVPVTPALWFSEKYMSSDGSLQQGCCVQSAPGTYHFNVKYMHRDKTGAFRRLTIDPEIIVTPQ